MNQEAQNTTVSLNILLPQSVKDFIDQQVAKGGYDSPSDYVCDLVCKAKERAAETRLEKLLLEALDSGPATPMTKEDWEEIKQSGAARVIEKLLLEALDSGNPIEITAEYWKKKRAELIAKYGTNNRKQN